MIERLVIRELALVEELELELARGLNVFTGETGAGKSIVLGALALVAGARAPVDAVREGADEARVEAVLDTRRLPELEAALADRAIPRDGHELIARRSLSKSGRSRAWLGADGVPVGALAELLGEVIEVSSQHASQALLRPEVQGRLLDEFGDCLALRAEVEAGARTLRAQGEEIARLEGDAEERARRGDYLAFQLRELDEARLDVGEARALEEEHRRLANAEQLRSEAQGAAALLLGEPEAPDPRGAADLVSGASRAVAALAGLDPGLRPLAERLAAANAELSDLAADLERYAGRSEADPGRLAELDQRLREIERVRRKYGGSLEAAIAFREHAADELAALARGDERLGKLAAEREAERARLERNAARLSRERARAAAALGEAASRAMRELALPQARFAVELVPVTPPAGLPCATAGAEAAEFLFAANPGEPLRPLRNVASGGELSRVYLALQEVLRTAGAGRVLVFDEVDAGIGGAVAERVGARLAALAAGGHQVLCITHLPQIAVHAERHFRVEKQSARGRTRTRLTLLDEAGRVAEVARMAGGAEVGPATLDHARALLAGARKKGARRARTDRSPRGVKPTPPSADPTLL